MKNVLFLFLVFFSSSIVGQSNSEVAKQFKFDNETAEEEVTIVVEPNTKFLSFQFQGQIESGELKITIKDPKNKKEGGFQLKSKSSKTTSSMSSSGGTSSSSSSTNSSTSSNSNSNSNSNSSDGHTYSFSSTSSDNGKTSGSMNKQIENPLAGEWKVVIQTLKVNGKAALMIGQSK